MLVDIIVSLLASALSSLMVALVCSPIIWVSCWKLKREYSFDFWVRTILVSQLLFWGGLLIAAAGTKYGLVKTIADLMGILMNFVISIPATALMMRSCMRLKANRPDASKDKLDAAFGGLKTARKYASKAFKD